MIESYLNHKKEREASGIPPKPLTAAQVSELAGLLETPEGHDPKMLVDLISNRVPAGVDEAARIKADFLNKLAWGNAASPLITPEEAVFLLGTMRGGYNTEHLIGLLAHHERFGAYAAEALVHIILVFDAFEKVQSLHKTNADARRVMEGWANAEWFSTLPAVPESITLTAFRVKGEINTDDLSPAGEAWSRPDIPLHALAMLENRIKNPIEKIALLKKKGYPLVFVGDVTGTGSSRKSAANSLLWHIGKDIPYVPNKRFGGYVIGGKIAPIFFNSLEDAGTLPLECDVSKINDGDILSIHPYDGKIYNVQTGKTVAVFEIRTKGLLDEVRAGGRIPLIIGRSLSDRAAKAMGRPYPDMFARSELPPDRQSGYSLAQKMVGRACGRNGISPGTYCEPKIATVGSQDTTGPMTRDELSELACLKFKADLVMQSFCHTAAYPRTVDVEMHESLHRFVLHRGGVALYPGDGIIHSWLNRMILPDTVGTGGDSHTRFPVGISFPAGSGMVAFAAAIGFMPIDMPESVLVKLSGKLLPGITIRDMVNYIAMAAIRKGLLTVDKADKINVFSGRIMEMEGLPDLTIQQAFELTNASAERSASAASIALGKKPVMDFVKGSVSLLKSMIDAGYGDSDAILRRIREMEKWLADPVLLKRDLDAQFAHILEVHLEDITEPVLACPNDPDDVRFLSEVAGTPVDEVFIGSCMTGSWHLKNAGNILAGHRSVPARLWITPGTRMDAAQLKKEGYYAIYGRAGARIEIPGCSLCMGNQARVADNATVVSTSTRNFPNRIGNNTNVYLASAELAAVTSILGRIPKVEEYMAHYSRV